MQEVKPCPFCGSSDIEFGGFSISPDCFVRCKDYGAIIEMEASWKGCNSVGEHDQKSFPVLLNAWNNVYKGEPYGSPLVI